MSGKFKKGFDERRNLKGRPKASAGSVDDVREWVTYLIEKNWHKVENALEKMTDEKAAYFIVQYLLKYKLPAPQDELVTLTDEQIDRLADKVKTKYFNNDTQENS